MKKKLLIALASIIVIAFAILGYAAANLNSLIAKFKPDIEKVASEALKTQVTLGELEASIFPEARVHVKELKLTPKNAKEGFTLNDLFLSVRILPLLSGKLEVAKLTITKPTVTVLKGPKGFSIAGLPSHELEEANAKAKSSEAAQSTATASEASAPAPSAISLNLEEFRIEDASVLITDDKGTAPVNLVHTNIQAAISFAQGTLQVSDIDLNGELLSSGKLDFTGQLSNLGTKNPRVELSGAITSLDFKSFHPVMALLGIAVPPHQGTANLNLTVAGDLLSPEIKGKLDLNVNNQPIALNFDTSVSPSEINAKAIQVLGFGGSIDNTALFSLISKAFTLDSTAKGLQVEPLLTAAVPTAPAMLTGTVKSFTLNLKGVSDSTLMQNLSGKATLDFIDGALKGTNIAGQVLQAVSALPFLSGSLFSKLPPEQIAAINGKDTALKSVTGNFTIGGNGMNTEDLLVDGGIFKLYAKGRVGFDTSIDLNATIKFSPEFSESLASAVKEIKTIYDPAGQLVIPLQITGKAPEFKVLPNTKDLLKLAGKSALADKAGQLLNKALGGDSRKSTGLEKLFKF